MKQILLQNATATLLQNATEVYYKMCQVFYYKMRQLLQNATFITNYDSATCPSKKICQKLAQFKLLDSQIPAISRFSNQ